jgi:hypothetical protein
MQETPRRLIEGVGEVLTKTSAATSSHLGQCNPATGRLSSARYYQRRDHASTDLREEVEALNFTIH